MNYQINKSVLDNVFEEARKNPDVFTFACEDIAEATGVSTLQVSGCMFAISQLDNIDDESQSTFLADYVSEYCNLDVVYD